MKRSILALALVALVASATYGSTRANFYDTETSEDNNLTAGTLDLTVDGEDYPLGVVFEADEEYVVPGETYNLGCVELENVGTIDGLLSLKILNPVSNENGIMEPEEEDGDLPDTEIDDTGGGFDQNEGDGELWDQLQFMFFIDEDGNEVHDFGEPRSKHGTLGDALDLSSAAHVELDTDLFPFEEKPGPVDYTETLTSGETVSMCMTAKFLDDDDFWGAFGSLTNNLAMSDDVTFDIVFGLEQL